MFPFEYIAYPAGSLVCTAIGLFKSPNRLIPSAVIINNKARKQSSLENREKPSPVGSAFLLVSYCSPWWGTGKRFLGASGHLRRLFGSSTYTTYDPTHLATIKDRPLKVDMFGIIDGKLTPCPDSPNCVSSQSENLSHFIKPLFYKGSMVGARQRLLRVVGSMKRTRVIKETEEYIHVTFTSRWFRFVDDVEFCFAEEAPVIHVRSASRVGYSDLGVNRSRIEKIRRAFESSK